MSEEENSYLRKEISRLNQIITVLLEQNEVLKREISYVKNYIAAKTADNSNEKIFIGEGNIPVSNEKISIGENNNPYSYDKINIGEENIIPSYEEIIRGIGIVPSSNDKTNIGKGNDVKPLPEVWAIDDGSVRLVSKRLKEVGLRNVKKMGKRNISKLLLHFHNKGKGSYAELRKLTGLSEGGLAKLIMSLKKRGLIHRSAYQQFELGATAKQLLENAYQDTGKGWFSGRKVN